VRSSTREPHESGATKQVIAHAVLLPLTTTDFPDMTAALQWVDALLEQT